MANSARLDLKLEGFKEFRELLTKIPAAMHAGVLAGAVEQASKPIVQRARRNAPVSSGALRKSITSIVRQYPRNGKTVGVIGPSNDYFSAGGKRLKKGARGPNRPKNYAHLVEYGHHSAAGKGVILASTKNQKIKRSLRDRLKGKGKLSVISFVPPKPFLRPAFEQGKMEASTALARYIDAGWKKQVERLAKKNLKRTRA